MLSKLCPFFSITSLSLHSGTQSKFHCIGNVNKRVYLNFNRIELFTCSIGSATLHKPFVLEIYYTELLHIWHFGIGIWLVSFFRYDLLAFTRRLSFSKISWKEVLVKSGISGYFVVYYKIPGANFIWKCNNCSCIAAAAAIPCAGFVGICFLFLTFLQFTVYSAAVCLTAPAIHQRRCFPLFGAVSWNWERLLGWCGSFFLHSLCSAQQRCSQSICMHMIGGHFRWVTELMRHGTSIIHFYTRFHTTPQLSIYSRIKMEAKDFHLQSDKELNFTSANSVNPPGAED